jgi:hypothetical protein
MHFYRPVGGHLQGKHRVNGNSQYYPTVATNTIQMSPSKTILLSFGLLTLGRLAIAQEPTADLQYLPPITQPAYTEHGPVVCIDEAHRNYHTLDGRYAAFAQLAQRDGYQTKKCTAAFTPTTLQGIDILVIANADSSAASSSAFTDTETTALHAWVLSGGSLLIITDHPPFSNAITTLTKTFDFEVIDGVALQVVPDKPLSGLVIFQHNGLSDSIIRRGRNDNESIDHVVTFTGAAFKAPATAISLLTFLPGAYSFAMNGPGPPDVNGPKVSIAGLSQGAIMSVGNGRLAIFGEAAMFSAQRGGPNFRPMGMNSPEAAQNYQFVLNLLHWLSKAPGMPSK